MPKLLLRKKENITYLILWVLLFLTPVLSLYIRSHNAPGLGFQWEEVFSVWKTFLLLLVVFLIHNFLLAPLLVEKKKTWLYLGMAICLVAVFVLIECAGRPDHGVPYGQVVPPEFRAEGVQPGQPGPRKPDFKPDFSEDSAKMLKERNDVNVRHHVGPDGPPVFFGEKDWVSALVIILLFGMNLGIKLYCKSEEDDKALQEIEKDRLEQQLVYLQGQVNPHFFMNTLNNIHALVDIDPEEAKQSIVELSKMMRYLLYEANHKTIAVSKEIQFIKDYITLMRLRFTDKVRIDATFPDTVPSAEVTPMLLIPFVENAFKHGISYQKDSFVKLDISISGNHLLMTCGNSKVTDRTAPVGGVGITNARKRMDLVYGTNYVLDIDDGEDTYTVKLEIPL